MQKCSILTGSDLKYLEHGTTNARDSKSRDTGLVLPDRLERPILKPGSFQPPK
jgi:hypothetical protein